MLKTLPALAALLASGVVLVPTLSHAQETRSARVSYADLNLATGSGRQELHNRIASAAKSVCDTSDVEGFAFRETMFDCSSTAIANAEPAFEAAVAQSMHPSVTVLESSALVVSSQSTGK